MYRPSPLPVYGGLSPSSIFGSVTDVGGSGDIPPVAGSLLLASILGMSAACFMGTQASYAGHGSRLVHS